MAPKRFLASVAGNASHVVDKQELMEHFAVGAQDGVVILGIGEAGGETRRVGVAPELIPQFDWDVGGVGEGLHGLDASDGRARDDAPHLVLHQQRRHAGCLAFTDRIEWTLEIGAGPRLLVTCKRVTHDRHPHRSAPSGATMGQTWDPSEGSVGLVVIGYQRTVVVTLRGQTMVQY